MNQTNIQIIAARLRGLAKEAIAIAELLEAQAPSYPASDPVQRSGDGSIYVTLPGPDLFSELDKIAEAENLQSMVVDCSDPDTPTIVSVSKRPRRSIATRMTEHLSVSTTDTVGKAEGFCIRNDIERRVADITGRSREDVREALNRVADDMRITCVVSKGYRYYPRGQRAEIIDRTCEMLERL